MKVTIDTTTTTTTTATSPPNIQPSDLNKKPTFPKKPPRRKTKAAGAGVRWKRDSGAPPSKKSSRPETPLLKWKFDEANDENDSVEEEKSCGEGRRKIRREVREVASARKLGACLWRMHSTEFGGEKLNLESRDANVGVPTLGHCFDRVHSSPAKDLVHSPHFASGPGNGHLYKFEPSFQFSNTAMEGATKWDPVGRKTSDELKQTSVQPKLLEQKASVAPVISALKTELEQAKARINELESKRKSSQKKLEQFLQKLSEERAAWRSREHEKIRAIIDDMKVDLNREKKNRQRLEIVNNKLVNELSEAKLSAKRYAQEYEKERKTRELIEEVCDELAKEIGEDKAEVEALKKESMQLQEEVDDERKMLQMAEVWREERVQMKLIDAKVMLEEKYSHMNQLIADLESFLNSSIRTLDLEEKKKAEFLKQVAASVDIQDVRELKYEPPNSDDIFSVFEEMNFGGSSEKEVEQCGAYSPASHGSKIHRELEMLNNQDGAQRHSSVYRDQSGELEEDTSEWETVSHLEDQGSSYSPDGSDRNYRISSVSRTGAEWERNGGEEMPPFMKIQSKKGSSISKLWKSSNGDNFKVISVDGIDGRISNGRLSNGVIVSPDHRLGKHGHSPQDMAGEWSSPDAGNPHLTRGMKGCIEWPRSAQKSSLKSRLLEARMDSQKIQLRQVLKQKI